MSFPFFKQLDAMDCGPTSLRMIAKHYGKNISISYLREHCYITRRGVSLLGISEAADKIGFRTMGIKVPFESDEESMGLVDAPVPFIAHWNQKHFLVVYRINKRHVWISDPASGKYKLTKAEFCKHWLTEEGKGIVLLLEITSEFNEDELGFKSNVGFGFLKQYFKPHKKLLFQVILGLLLGTIFQLIVPFLTQSLVDIGIDTKNLNFIYLVLAGQLMLFFSSTVVKFIQSWILLHVSVRINVSLISDFLSKLMRLPISFFDTKHTGDLLQRIGDHKRIETFLTQSSISVLLSITNLVVFGIVLGIYSLSILGIFVVFSLLYVFWIFFFLKVRKEVDYKAFQELSDNQDSLIEIIQGISEIKMQGSQNKRRLKWTEIQARYFKTQIKSLSITQYQDAGAMSINQLKDILITFLAAKLVLEGSMTLGMMLAIQYIIGQLNGPLSQLIGFIRAAQDASISLERLSEIHVVKNEEDKGDVKINQLPEGDIVLKDLNFSYTPITEQVLKNINLTIPRGKTTAIVGTSGSGKTTLIKLLLGFYQPSSGSIKIGPQDLSTIQLNLLRKKCGVVLQDGFVFSDTIANNIAESDTTTNISKVLAACTTANIMDYVQSLPLGLNTVIGAKGNGLSQGQNQRLFIARAVYKDPEILFFDEATNALDANNELVIMKNLKQFSEGKTTIVVAHRLSTVKYADQIVVLENGEVAEHGSHAELVLTKGKYFQLIKNQLELGS